MSEELILSNRCQRVLPSGQCANEALPGTDRCEQHTGKLARRRADSRNYHLQDVRAQGDIDRLLESEALYTLREEIALTRKLAQATLEGLKFDGTDKDNLNLAIKAPMLIRFVETLQKLVTSGLILEQKTGNILTKTTIMKLAQRLVDIMAETLEEAGVSDFQLIVDSVTQRYGEEIAATQNPIED